MQNLKIEKNLPENQRKDAQMLSLAKALTSQIQQVRAQIETVKILSSLEKLPEKALDALAWQYHVDFYLDTLPRAEKINLIRRSIWWHRIKGTPAAVEGALKTYLGEVQVQEWFEYGGEPGFFKLSTSGYNFITSDEEFLYILNQAKNVRSWLEAISIDLEELEQDYSGGIEVEGGVETTDVAYNDKPEKQLKKLGILELESGLEITDIAQPREEVRLEKLGILELEGGVEVTESEYKARDEDWIFRQYLRQKWEKFKRNPVIVEYEHIWDFDGELDEGEIFPINSDFLRLYFEFPHGVRYITLSAPREDLTGGEINQLGEFVAQNALLTNKKQYYSDGICRALLITKRVEKVL